MPVVALVGYTNAGKSTLLNHLSGADAYVADQLFATLDPIMRKTQLNDKTQVLVVDTVGFVNKLPHDLVDAFRSTLEESVYADLLVHVADGSSDEQGMQMQVVRQVLEQLGAQAPQILVMNKWDLVPAGTKTEEEAIYISAVTGEGIEELKAAILNALSLEQHSVDWLIPYTDGALMAKIHEVGQITSQAYEPDGIRIQATLPAQDYERLKKRLPQGE
jgi:GTP-binding protein HflX